MWVFKTFAQCVTGCIISSILVGLSRSSIKIEIGGAFGLYDGTGKIRSSFGIAEQLPENKCTMKVVNPFEVIPDTIPGNYICSWDNSDLVPKDALCFDPFECTSLHMLWVMYLLTGCIYLISYLLYGIIWTVGYLGWVQRGRRVNMLYASIVFVMLSNFIFNKVLDKYLMEVFIDEFSEKIRTIVSNNGYPGFKFKGDLVYELQGTKKIAQSLFDICSGMIMGMVFSAIENIRKPFRPRIHNDDLMGGLIL